MTIEIPKGLYALLGVLFVVVAAAVPLSLLWRRRAATPAPVQPTTGEQDEATAVDDRARSARAILDAAAAKPGASERRDSVADLVNR